MIHLPGRRRLEGRPETLSRFFRPASKDLLFFPNHVQ